MERTDLGEVFFEFVRMGNAVKVTAIHALTGTEVAIVGAANMSPFTLKANALRKLQSVIAKKAGGSGR